MKMEVKEYIMSIIKYYNNLLYPMDRTYVQLDIIINMHKLAATNNSKSIHYVNYHILQQPIVSNGPYDETLS